MSPHLMAAFFVYAGGFIITFLLVMTNNTPWEDTILFWMTVVIFWPIAALFLLVAVPFVVIDMCRTLYYKFRHWRIQTHINYDSD